MGHTDDRLRDKFESRISDLLKKHKDLTILDISDRLRMDRHTAAKYLQVMKSKGMIDFKDVGKSKIWNISNAPILNALKNNDNLGDNLKQILGSVDEHVSIQNKDMNVIWTNKQSDIDHKCHVSYAGKLEVCRNCPVEKSFRTGKSESAVMNWPKNKVRIITQPIKNSDDETVAVVEIVKDMTKR